MTAPKKKRPAYAKVYNLIDSDEPAVVRYSGDPDEYYALAWSWLMDEHGLFYDHPIAVAPPQPRWFRMNAYQGDDYGWLLGFADGPGRGNWLGSYLRIVKIGCSECRCLHGRHADGCLNAGIVGLETCMLTLAPAPGFPKRTRRRAADMIHLVRMRSTGTPGPTLCGLDRFGPGTSFSMGGGYTYQGQHLRACYMCVKVARREFPGLKVNTGMREFAQLFVSDGLPVADSWATLTPDPGTPGAWALAGKGMIP